MSKRKKNDNDSEGSSDSEVEVVENEHNLSLVKLLKTSVHDEFQVKMIIHPKSGKQVEGRKCNHCPQVFQNKNPMNLKAHLKAKHSKIAKLVEEKDKAKKLPVIKENQIRVKVQQKLLLHKSC